MSVFFKALEQAEHDRHGQRPAAPVERDAPSVAVIDDRRAAPPVTPGELDEHLVSLTMPVSFAAEQYRALRHTVEQARLAVGHTAFGIGSPESGDGKTTTAINLAGALAQARDARVLLIEADLRSPQVAERLGLGSAPRPGLVDAIQATDLALDDVVVRLPAYNLSVVLAGRRPVAPYEVLKSPRLGHLLDEGRRDYDYVLLDTPPLVAFPDCRIIGSYVDGWLVVVAAHRTGRDLLGEALDLLEPSKTMGFVFTHDERFRANGRYYGGYYGAGDAR